MKAANLSQAITGLQHGEVVAYPTEAVWGLGCDPGNTPAIQKILYLKSRPAEKGLILVAASYDQIEPILCDSLNEQARDVLKRPTERPTSWLVPFKTSRLSPLVSGKHKSVAIRISSHPVVKALCEGFGGPIVSTSANPAGALPARYAFQVRRYFGDEVLICQGVVGKEASPSIIRDILSLDTIRE